MDEIAPLTVEQCKLLSDRRPTITFLSTPFGRNPFYEMFMADTKSTFIYDLCRKARRRLLLEAFEFDIEAPRRDPNAAASAADALSCKVKVSLNTSITERILEDIVREYIAAR